VTHPVSATAPDGTPLSPVGDTSPSTAPPTHLSPPARAGMARIIICVCLAVTLLASASVFWRWSSVQEPTSYIVVHGDSSHTGTVVDVTSLGHPGAMATLSKENEFSTSIFVHAGSYRVIATCRGEELVNTTLLIGNRQAAIIDLRRRKVQEARSRGRYLPDVGWIYDRRAAAVAYPTPPSQSAD
jgi:hypothetical protein